MAFIAFDLDETIGRFSTADGYLHFLNPSVLYQNMLKGHEPFSPSTELQAKIQSFFSAFVDCIHAKEPNLGMFRPGIFDIMKRVSDAKDRGQVKKVAIYSNNGNMNCLLLASQVIQKQLGRSDFFCDHVNWYDPRRTGEIERGRPGMATKSIAMLKTIFQGPKCGSNEDISNKQIYFFDDTVHQNILNAIGISNYFKVEPFKHDASYYALDECFTSAKEKTGIFEDEEYMRYITPILASMGQTAEGGFTSVMAGLAKYNNRFKNDSPQILDRLDKVFSYSVGNNYFPVVDGGRRRRRTRKHRKN